MKSELWRKRGQGRLKRTGFVKGLNTINGCGGRGY